MLGQSGQHFGTAAASGMVFDRRRGALSALYAMATLLAAVMVPSIAEAHQCQAITSLPSTIASSGCYTLAKSFRLGAIAGQAIWIDADDVAIDLAGHHIEADVGLRGTTVGIYANKRQRIAVRNGSLSGFFYGIRIDAGRDVTIENLVISKSTFRGLGVDAAPARVRDNRISDTGGTQVFEDAFAVGIEVFGRDCLIEGNTVEETYPQGIGEGVAISNSGASEGCVVRGNTLRNSRPRDFHRTFGYWISDDTARNVEVSGNEIRGFTYGIVPKRDRGRAFPDNIAIKMRSNRLVDIDCSPLDFPNVFLGLDPTNEFREQSEGCTDSIASRTQQWTEKVWKSEPRALFALAMAYYANKEGLLRDGALTREQVVQRLKAIGLLRRSAELGLAEARRILPGVVGELRREAAAMGVPVPE